MEINPQFVVRKHAAVAMAGLAALGTIWGPVSHAEPAQDGVAKLKDLTRQAEQMIQTVQSAQLDLDKKVQLETEAAKRHADAVAALDTAKAQLASQQAGVDKVAAAVYVGGRTDSVYALLTAGSPKSLIDDLAIQRAVATTMSDRMHSLRDASLEAQAIEAASAKSALDAKAAAEAAAAVRADLQKKESQLQTQIAQVKVTYGMLPPAQQAVLGPGAAIPTVGMGGLVPNARNLAAYIIATFPGVQSIGGVRQDPLPDHPSGHAIDIMIGSDMALGDAINADIQSKSGQFGVSYTMWRVANHFNHVHVTVF